MVDERAAAVDLDHRQPLAVARLELGVGGPSRADPVEVERITGEGVEVILVEPDEAKARANG